MTHKFNNYLDLVLKDKRYENKRIIHHCNSEIPSKMENGAFLMGCFMVVILKMSAENANARFKKYESLFKHYRDASKGDCLYNCTLLHCLQGLEYGIKLKWYNFETFNIKHYEKYEQVQNGDLNWIIPGKFVAFMGPIEKRDANQRYGLHPSKYVKIFKGKFDVTRVVRLNEEKYNKDIFIQEGIYHDDLFFTDGSTPPDKIVDAFMDVCDRHFENKNPGAIAIHCKAGLGRTGTLIGLWAMKHY